MRIKKVSYAELAKYLNVTVSAVSKYPPKKRLLMLIGLATMQEPKKEFQKIDIDDSEIPFD